MSCDLLLDRESRSMDEATPRREWERYFQRRYGDRVRVVAVTPLGEDAGEKRFGFGVPLRVTLAGAPVEEVVIHTGGTRGFGHDTLADRGAAALLAYETFNNLPRHVRALDMGVMEADGTRLSLGEARDFFLITEYGEGEPYFQDLDCIGRMGQVTPRDIRRVNRLAAYLAEIHADRKTAPELYLRRTRELFGHHECIPGLLDSYDAFPLTGFTSARQLREIERRCVDWRHRLKGFTHRLCRVHGDFHPWNVLWGPNDQLTVLDRSRGEWGEAADDVSGMAINFLFFFLQASTHSGSTPPFAGPFQELWNRFFESYLAATGDEELLRVIPPYFVWRALVVASPLWYPGLEVGVRRRLFCFIDRLLKVDTFDWRDVHGLLRDK